MNFLEKDLEQIIYEVDNSSLRSRGLYIYGNKLRQTRIGNYGISDLITIDKEYNTELIGFVDDKPVYGETPVLLITVYELKKDEINLNTYHQAVRYCKGIISFLDKRKFNFEYKCSITLVGRTMCEKSILSYLPEIHDNINIYTYDYALDGIKFNLQGTYSLIDEGF